MNKKDVVVFKCPYSQAVKQMGIPQEFKRLKRELQQMRGSDFLRDTRCVVAHPTATNCFIESYGLNFVPEDRRRDTALQEVTAGEDESPGGRVTWASHTDARSD